MSTGASVAEDRCAIADELHQGGCALQFRVAHELAVAQPTVVEADRTHVEAPALLGELIVDPLHRRLHAFADRGHVAVESAAHAFRRQPHHHLITAIESRPGRQVGRDDGIRTLAAVTAADYYSRH